jgi:hypothetical protein
MGCIIFGGTCQPIEPIQLVEPVSDLTLIGDVGACLKVHRSESSVPSLITADGMHFQIEQLPSSCFPKPSHDPHQLVELCAALGRWERHDTRDIPSGPPMTRVKINKIIGDVLPDDNEALYRDTEQDTE